MFMKKKLLLSNLEVDGLRYCEKNVSDVVFSGNGTNLEDGVISHS